MRDSVASRRLGDVYKRQVVDRDCVAVDLCHRAPLGGPECDEVRRPGVNWVLGPAISVGINNIRGGHFAITLVELDSLAQLKRPSSEVLGDRPRLSQRALDLFVDVDGYQAFTNRGRLLHEQGGVDGQCRVPLESSQFLLAH